MMEQRKERHGVHLDQFLDPDERLEKRKEVLLEIVFLASVLKRNDFECSRIGRFKQPLTDVCDQDFLDRIYEMAQMKMIRNAMEEFL